MFTVLSWTRMHVRFVLLAALIGSSCAFASVLDVPLENFANHLFTGLVSLGTPAQHLRALFDTGRFSVWVPKRDCKTEGLRTFLKRCEQGRDVYEPDESDTSELREVLLDEKNENEQVQVNGLTYWEEFWFGNSSSEEHVKLHERVKIGVAIKITGRDTAVVGLARGTEHQTNNVLMEACRFNVLDKCLFSTHFRRCAEFADCAQGGNLRLGAEDEQHCEPVAEHGWVPLLPEADPDAPTKLDATWRFALEGLSFDGESLELGLADTAMSISGTPYVWLPENVYNAVMEKLKTHSLDGEGKVLPCEGVELKMTFRIQGQDYTLTQEHLLLPRAGPPGVAKCAPRIRNSHDHVVVLGMPFHLAYCLVHDVTDKKLGIAAPKNS